MIRRKHKRKVSRIILLTTDAVDAKVRQLKIHPWVGGILLVILCLIIGGVSGFLMYEDQIWNIANERVTEKDAVIAELQDTNTDLESQIISLNDKIEALSTAVNEKVQTAATLEEEFALLSMPTDYPLTGSSGIENAPADQDPMCIFTAAEGITVVATAQGKVTAVEVDETYGNRIIVDHGNGYITIYRNKGEAQVNIGDSVVKGTTLFIIGADNKELGYQIIENGAYIDPMTMLAIDG